MDSELLLSAVSRIAHVGTVIILIGGTACLRYAVFPSLPPGSEETVERIRNRWRRVVHAGIGIVLLSGIYNLLVILPRHKGDVLYHGLIHTKILLALFVFFLASVLVGRRPGSRRFRENSAKWTTILLLTAFLIVAVSGFLKVRPYTPPADDNGARIQPETPSVLLSSDFSDR
ncbi:MAG: hypothetical protein KDA89_03780 [Planctomycetaceae bacterium]|nr:hypothetical protein [Planctomycetaceae bacterium]